MFNLTPKSKGKTVKTPDIEGAEETGVRRTKGHKRGHVGKQEHPVAPPAETDGQSGEDETDQLTGDPAATSSVEPGGEQEGPETPVNIADEPSIASAIKSIHNLRKARKKPGKYDLATNTYR